MIVLFRSIITAKTTFVERQKEFFECCVPPAEREMHFVRDDRLRRMKVRITSLRPSGQTSLCKTSLLCYNIIEITVLFMSESKLRDLSMSFSVQIAYFFGYSGFFALFLFFLCKTDFFP